MSRMTVEEPGAFTEPVSTPAVPSPEPGQPDSAGLADFGITSMDAIRTTAIDPAVSERQQRFFGAVLGRIRAGKHRKGDPRVTEEQAREFAKSRRKR